MEVLYEMLPQQKKIWEIQMSYQGTDICNIGGYLHLEGKYDTALLQKTMEVFLQCNSSFWMKINSEGKVYFDKIKKYTMKEYDFSGLREKETDAIVQEWICEPFPLYDSYLFDFRLLHVQGKIVVFQKFHHLIADGYSVALCAKYQERIYEQLLEGKTDFEIDERYRSQISLAKTVDLKNIGCENEFENDQLVSLAKRALNPSACILSGWVTEGENKPDEIEWYKKRFPYKQIRELCRMNRVSVEALFYGCMAMYLCKVMDGKGLAVGRNLLGRLGEEMAVTGMKVDTQVFVVQPEWDRPAAEFLADIKKKLADHVSGKCAWRSRPEIEISYRPVRYLPSPKQGECVEFYSSSVEVPVKIFLNEGRSGIELVVKYQKEAISERRIRQIMEKTLFFMEQILNRPKMICNQVKLLNEDEEQQIPFRQRGEDWQFTVSLPERFLNMVRLYPERTAIFWKEEVYSYQDFYFFVKSIMNIIADRADESGKRVIGLCLSRTPYLPAAVYASWLLGYAFLPISPRETEERQREIGRHCALCLTDDMVAGSNIGEDEVEMSLRLDIPAYEIYTSGTTGIPKAVRISHQSLSCRLEWMEDTFSDGTDRILQKTRNTFDVSVWELALPFAFGKSLYILEDGKESNPRAIAEALAFGKVTMVHFVPSMFRRFLSFAGKEKWDFPHLKYIILSGEELGAELVQRAKALFLHTQVCNLYGPTECTIDVSYYRCRGDEERVPIGRPVYATGLSVRNKRGELLPVGERGELVVEGCLVGLGYHGSEEGFGYDVLDGKKVYWTGDMAVLDEDGLLYYEGRKDAQVKIRGMRINLMEVERSLNHAIPEVRSLVFQMENRLIAFCQGNGTPDRMKKEAGKYLPYYSIPSEFVFLKELPVQENGKADRKELERIYQSRCNGRANSGKFSRKWEYARRERVLFSLAKKHLKRSDLTLDDSLLDFGMDSLTALSFLADCEEYGICISYTAFYEKPCIRALAKESLNVRQKGEEVKRKLVFLQRSGSKRLLLIIPFAGGTPLSAFPLASQFSKGELDVAAVNLAAFRGKSIETLAKEVAASKHLEKYDEIYMLGACVGSVPAIQIAALLGERSGGLMLCEALPNRTCIWDYVPDAILANFLMRFRGKPFTVEREMLKGFREDVRKSAACIRHIRNLHIKGKVVLVFGDKDIVTSGYRKRYLQWHRWLRKPFRIYAIPEARHFLMEDYPSWLARIFRKEFV